MLKHFLAALLLIIAPVSQAAEQDMEAFFKAYNEYREARDAAALVNLAAFSGTLKFRYECGNYYLYDSNGEVMSCDCPQGNNHLPCLESVKAIITTDPKDYDGQGYVMVMASYIGGVSLLDRRGRWVPVTSSSYGNYSFKIDRMKSQHSFDIPIPKESELSNACLKDIEEVHIWVGYGAVMPMDIEFARRMKERSAEFGKNFDETKFLWARARLNGVRPQKAGEIGVAICPYGSGKDAP